ncbi:glycosyltransferase family 2 protein [Pseudalkalibacillus caeni]|uniref:Glycosyltransferase n=1 Tax=Exobacillus caeni TaxID=2574798 RepID=A0A5R9FD97_9BACL|nr:glycosyltransferase family 2 protein [Pseudalkalibacillus caeni]TLS37625.1 glycosyltransferase [Pseudalkalibacillus caeni]
MLLNQPLLTIVIPCYNEEEVLNSTICQLSNVLEDLISESLISKHSRLLFVDDGSKDRTWQIIRERHVNQFHVTGLKLARNVGHQKALLAGLEKARKTSDCVISIDADLQDDTAVIKDFILKYLDGCDIVYGVRKKRTTDTFFKRTTATGFYKFMTSIGIPLVPNHADYRLMSKRALEELSKFTESNLFLRGIVPIIGFKSACIYYDRKERLAGETKYPLKKMLSFAFDGITSFSIAPIRFITILGFILFLLSGVAGGYALIQKFYGYTSSGWTSLIISIWFLGGLQLISIGLLGEYIGKIFVESKRRPKYAVETDLFTSPVENMKSKRARIILEEMKQSSK